MKTFRWMKGILLAALLLTANLNPAAAEVVPFVTPSPLPTFSALTPMATAEPMAAAIPALPSVDVIGPIAENVVVALNTPAPSATESPVLYVEAVNPYAIDLESYYANVQSFLEPGDADRFARAQQRWNSGERPENSVLNLTENVIIGVYALPEEQYQGEKAFLLLPDHELTDEECLQIVDAYQQLGLTFDPAKVSWRNCMRGGSIECSRSWAGDERERVTSLTELYKRNGLRPEAAFTALPGDDGVGEISLNMDEYNGLAGYRFRPARRLTDDEILQFVAMGTGEVALSAGEYAELESHARMLLHQTMGMELSAERLDETIVHESDYFYAVSGTDRQMYDTQFRAISDSTTVYSWNVNMDMGTRELIHAYASCKMRPYCDVREDPFSDKWRSIALNWLKENRSIPFEVAAVECLGEDWLQECGYGAYIRLILTDGSSYDLRFHFEDGSLHDASYSDAIRTANEQAFYLNEYVAYDMEEEVDK